MRVEFQDILHATLEVVVQHSRRVHLSFDLGMEERDERLLEWS